MKQLTPRIAKGLVPAVGLIAALGLLASPLLVVPVIVLGVSLLRPRTVGMPILILLIPVQFFVSSFGLTFSFVDVLVLLLAMILLFQTLALKREFRWSPLWLPFLAFGVALVIAAARSSDFAQAAITVMRLASYGVVYLLVLNFTESKADARRMLTSLFVAGGVVAFIGIGQSILGVSFTRHFLASRLGEVLIYGDTPTWVISEMTLGNFVRAYGLFMNPNWCGTYLAMLLAVALSLALSQQTAKPQLWLRVVILVWLVALALTLSRGAITGFVCAMAVLLMRRGAGKLIVAAGLMGILILCIYLIGIEAPGPFRHLSWQSVDWQGASKLSRVGLWHDAYKVLVTSPILGVGLGDYKRELSMITYGAWIVHPHSTYIELLIEGGIPTCLAFVWILWTVWARHWSMSEQLAPGLSRAVALGAACATVIFAVQSAVDRFYGDPKVAMVFWMIIGVSMRLIEMSADRQTDKIRVASR